MTWVTNCNGKKGIRHCSVIRGKVILVFIEMGMSFLKICECNIIVLADFIEFPGAQHTQKGGIRHRCHCYVRHRPITLELHGLEW